MPEPVERFTISIPPDLLMTFDEVCAGKGYASRSEAVRDAIRDYLVAHNWSGEPNGDVVGTITLVYGADGRAARDEATAPGAHARILSSLSVPLDRSHSLEVIVARGSSAGVAALADELISLRGVKHGRLVRTTTGDALP